MISDLAADWDIVLWGWNFDHFISLKFMEGVSPANVTCDQDQMRSAVGTFQALRDAPHLLRLGMCWGIPAYTISPGGASRLQAACFPLENFETMIPITGKASPNNGIDIAMNRAYATLQAYVSFPPLVVTRNEHASSTIQTQKPAGWVSRRLAKLERRLGNRR